MKYVLVFLIAGLHLNPNKWICKTPMPSLLGETHIGKNSKGMTICLEQTSINPPTTHFHIKVPDNSFECFGYAINFVKMTGVNTIKGSRDGKNMIKFKDGSLLTWICPEM